MATFSYTHDWSGRGRFKPRVNAVKMGDGYEQRQPDGINTNPGTWSLLFTKRTDADAGNIIAFFEARAGHEAFDWTPPVTGASSGKYVCEEWDRWGDAVDQQNVSATFRQVFEP